MRILSSINNLHYEKFQDGTMKCIEAEIPFELPEGWRWSRLGSLFSTITGNTPSTKNASLYGNDYPFYKPTDLEAGLYVYTSEAMVSEKGYQAGRGVPEHSVLITCIGATIGKTGYIRNTGICNQQINAILPHKFIAPEYTYFCMCSDFEQRQIWINSSSTTLPILNKSKFDNLLFPVPPLLEQSILIKEIKKLFQHVNIIQMEKSTLQETLRLTKNKILDLAIRGKLVPQDPNDEPASVLLERIKAEKEELIKQGKIKRDKKESIIFKGDDNSYYESVNEVVVSIEQDIPFELPAEWTWCRIRNIASVRGGKRLPKGANFSNTLTDHAYIRVTDMKNWTINTANLKYISDDVYEQIKSYTISSKDLYVTIAGTIGVVGEVPDSLEGMNLTENAVKICNIAINKEYLCYALLSSFVQQQFQDKTHLVAMPKLALERILTTLIPLPPLNEQKKIVNTINKCIYQLNSI